MSNSEYISELIQAIQNDGGKFVQGDDSLRKAALESAHRLCVALETPEETIMRLAMIDQITRATTLVAFDLKLFDHLSLDKQKAIGSLELAKATGADRALLVRLLRHLAASELIREAGPDRFYASELTKALADPRRQDIFTLYGATVDPSFACLREYFAKNGYKDITDGMKAPFQYGQPTDLHVFEWIRQHPDIARAFKNSVLSINFRRAHWGDPKYYPVKERLLAGFRDGSDSVLLVDVGGGTGPDITTLHKFFPGAPGRLVLQDLEGVLGGATGVPPRVEKMTHDFFHPQPVKGARAYYLHRVLHDWTDAKAREILLAIKSAMTPRYSKVLIQELAVPAQGASLMCTAPDLCMMTQFAGRERTEEDFRAIFEGIGMVVTGLWTRAPGEESVIEAIVPE